MCACAARLVQIAEAADRAGARAIVLWAYEALADLQAIEQNADAQAERVQSLRRAGDRLARAADTGQGVHAARRAWTAATDE